MLRRLIAALADSLLAQLAPHARPGSRLSHIVRPVINRLLPRGPRMVKVRSGAGLGLRLMIEPRTEKYYWTGMHEPHVQDAIVRSLPPGGTFWDVGAHIGLMSLIAARAVGADGTVIAFEPMPATRERLLASLAANQANVLVEPIALTNIHGSQTLHSAEASLMWTLAPGRGEQEGVLVPCSTLDTYGASKSPPDMIKIDVEGVEVDVLQGGCALIAAHHPVLLVEFSTESLLHEGRSLLAGEGYEWDHLGANHWLLTPRAGA